MLRKKPFTTSLKFQLVNTYTYEKKAALLMFCSNEMGNVPPLERFLENSSQLFPFRKYQMILLSF